MDAAKPPITALPNGADWSPASPIPLAIGIIPAIIARDVIKIGRKRILAATDAALKGSLYSNRNVSALVTINIAFATDTPTAIMIPIYDCRFSVAPVANNSNIAPNNTAGTVLNTTNETPNDWKLAASNSNITTIAANNPVCNEPNVSVSSDDIPFISGINPTGGVPTSSIAF